MLEVNWNFNATVGNGVLYKGSPCSCKIEIDPVYLKTTADSNNLKILVVLEDDDYWKFSGEKKDKEVEIDIKEGIKEIIDTTIIPCSIGQTYPPNIKILRVSEENTDILKQSSSSPESNDREENDSIKRPERKGSRKQPKKHLLLSRRTSSAVCEDQLQEFEDGEIVFSYHGTVMCVDDPCNQVSPV